MGTPDVHGRGRGIGGRNEDRWLARDRVPSPEWNLPGMGEAFANPPVEVKPRWGEINDPQRTPDGKPTVERWRGSAAAAAAAAAAANPQTPGVAPLEANAAAAGRGRGFAVGRGRGVMRCE